MNTPRFDFSNVPVCTPGMGPELAKLNGYKHGWEDKVTSNICTLVKGTTEYYAWHWGYLQGWVDLMDANRPEETTHAIDDLRIAK